LTVDSPVTGEMLAKIRKIENVLEARAIRI
jgi:hypothetical protein